MAGKADRNNELAKKMDGWRKGKIGKKKKRVGKKSNHALSGDRRSFPELISTEIVVLGPASFTSPGSLLEMQSLRSLPRPSESEFIF